MPARGHYGKYSCCPRRIGGVKLLNNLLLDEHPLLVMPRLAALIGLNESIVLQQIHYWLIGKEQRQQDYIDGHYWVYNTYEQWLEQFPFFSLRTLRRIFTALEKMGLLISSNYNRAGFDKTKWYTINYESLNKLVSLSGQNGHIVWPNCHNGSGQNDPTNTIDYTKITTERVKGLKGISSKQNAKTPFNPSILEKQIIKSCHAHEIQDCSPYIDIIKYYYSIYEKTFGWEHPRLSAKAMDSVIDSFLSCSDNLDGLEYDPDAYYAMIDRHFQTQYENCDYNICHFMSEEVRNNRFYETCC